MFIDKNIKHEALLECSSQQSCFHLSDIKVVVFLLLNYFELGKRTTLLFYWRYLKMYVSRVFDIDDKDKWKVSLSIYRIHRIISLIINSNANH